MPGALSTTTGTIKNANSTWLLGRPLDRDLTAALGRPVRLMNDANRSEEHTSELQSLMRISYAVFCLKNKNKIEQQNSIKEIHCQHTIYEHILYYTTNEIQTRHTH